VVPVNSDAVRSDVLPKISPELEAEFGRLLRGQAVWTVLAKEGPGLDPFSVEILAAIDRRQPVRASRLAEEFAVSRTAVSRHLSPLVVAELVLTLPDPQDGRAVLLELSEAGTAELRRHTERRRAAWAQLMAGWTHGEVSVFTTLLSRLNDAAESLRDRRRDSTWKG
jgi:DNA-binding MarR family transcriptional regulator